MMSDIGWTERDQDTISPAYAEQVFAAAELGDVATVAAALDRGFDPNCKNGVNPLLHLPICVDQAEAPDRLATVELLIGRGADPERTDAHGWTALLAACDRTDEDMIRLLLKNGANGSACDNKGWSTIHYLTNRQADREVIQLLLDAEANINHRSTDEGNTPLMLAVYHADLALIHALLDLGADPMIARKDGLTALHLAAKLDRVDSAQILLDAGADPNAIGGVTQCPPIHLAAGIGHRQMVELLLKRGADIRAVDRNGYTAFDVANGTGCFEISALLQAFEDRA